MHELKIAAIPADGIGKEVIAVGLEVLDVLAKRDGGFRLVVESFDWGSDYYKKHGVMMPDDGREKLKAFDAIYFGAVGAPDVPDHVTRCGAFASPSASRSINTPTSVPPVSFLASRAR